MAKKLTRQQKYQKYVERTLKRIERYEQRGWYIDPAYKAKIEQRMELNPRGKYGASSSTEMVTRRMTSAKELYKHASLSTDEGTITAKEAREQGYTFAGKRQTPVEVRRQREYEESQPSLFNYYDIAGRNFERMIHENIGDRSDMHFIYPSIDNVEQAIVSAMNEIINQYGYAELGRKIDGKESEISSAMKEMYYHPQSNEDIYTGSAVILGLLQGRPLTTRETMRFTESAIDVYELDSEVLE